jgi:hypothetical protein
MVRWVVLWVLPQVVSAAVRVPGRQGRAAGGRRPRSPVTPASTSPSTPSVRQERLLLLAAAVAVGVVLGRHSPNGYQDVAPTFLCFLMLCGQRIGCGIVRVESL